MSGIAQMAWLIWFFKRTRPKQKYCQKIQKPPQHRENQEQIHDS